MRESLNGVVKLHPQGSFKAVGSGGAERLQGTDILSAKSINPLSSRYRNPVLRSK